MCDIERRRAVEKMQQDQPNNETHKVDIAQFVDEQYCPNFTIKHGLDSTTDDAFYFAFVCSGSEYPNPLKGDPHEFQDQPLRCVRCTRVSVLVGSALEQFAEEVYYAG
ncbi:hypothetical protein [Halocatena salina]|uniref:Uncharacterized protein n=1 Tax=Halocatena salina TaxID=2934340 RepID=A0A8U0A5F0_9EURY|nr:hypothetical protein [Halocatena salina]UPM43173.1 hypothetical protein MW046_01690 [Halocatena salina]